MRWHFFNICSSLLHVQAQKDGTRMLSLKASLTHMCAHVHGRMLMLCFTVMRMEIKR